MSIKGWISPSTSERKPYAGHASVVKPAPTPGTTDGYAESRAAYREQLGSRPSATPPNERVQSKNTRRYDRNDMTGERPAYGPDREPGDAPPSLPATHVGQVMKPHVETVGWRPHTGKYVHPSHPVADAMGKTNAVLPHTRSEPTGQAHSASGGKHGLPPKRPESDPRERGATTAQNGTLNHQRDRNGGERGLGPVHHRREE